MLEPDLVILDEFQRFKDLMNGTGEDALLARHLFEFDKARVVLLSATPYKMLTLASAGEDEDHYKDFLDTLRFLITDPARLERAVGLVEDFRRRLLKLRSGGNLAAVLDAKEGLERELRRVIVRTERLSATEDLSGMVSDRHPGIALGAGDLRAFVGAQTVSRAVGDRDVMEFWKSGPHMLSFLDGYKLRDKLKGVIAGPGATQVTRAISSFPEAVVDTQAIRALQPIPVGNPRLGALLKDTVDIGAWRALWLPASLPYYAVPGPFAELRTSNFTKRLVFSAWKMVPRAVSTLISHAADVRTIEALEAKVGRAGSKERWPTPLLRIQEDADGRLTGLPLMLLLYPSISLARVDPLRIAADSMGSSGELPSLQQVIEVAKDSLEPDLQRLTSSRATEGAVDERWYWAAPFLMDLAIDHDGARRWLDQPSLAEVWQGEEGEVSASWTNHIEAVRAIVGKPNLGRPPADLLEVLAEAAIASPAVCSLRALGRQVEPESLHQARNAAARCAWALRNQLNLPESVAVIRAHVAAEPFWRAVIQYCAAGDLQSVLDEYVHVLRESLGLIDKEDKEILEKTAAAIQSALSVRAGRVGVDEFRINEDRQGFSMETQLLRSRFAMQYGSDTAADSGTDAKGGEVSRAGKVQDAFNSPFWPFVLASTSQGQEGLDFHPYCHCVVHWNLPSNPVDLEQREGRVHRFKGHAVRKNVAAKHGHAAYHPAGDPWSRAFNAARAGRAVHHNDLVPYWLYPIDGGAMIERCVPMLPLSREVGRLVDLRRTLAVYRMVFGQPRQDDLIEFLLSHFPEKEIASIGQRLRIDLSPHIGTTAPASQLTDPLAEVPMQ